MNTKKFPKIPEFLYVAKIFVLIDYPFLQHSSFNLMLLYSNYLPRLNILKNL